MDRSFSSITDDLIKLLLLSDAFGFRIGLSLCKKGNVDL